MTYDNIVLAVQDLSLSQIKDLMAELEELKVDKQKKAEQRLIEEMEQRAEKLGLSMESILVQARGTRGRAKGTSAAMYQNKANPKQTWAGKGRKPAWLQEQLDAGKQLSDFKI